MATKNKEVSLGALRSFSAVASFGSANAAAERTGVNPSTIWSQLGALEKYFQCELLDRSGGKLKPTQNGRLLLSYAERAIDAVDEAHQQISKSRPSSSMRLRADANVPHSALLDVVACLEELSPGTETEVIQPVDLFESRDQPTAIDLDLGLRWTSENDRPEDQGDWVSVGQVSLVWCVATDAKTSQRTALKSLPGNRSQSSAQADIQANTTATSVRIVRRRSNGAINKLENAAVKALNQDCKVISWCDSASILVDMVRSGLGAALLPISMATTAEGLQRASFANDEEPHNIDLVMRFPTIRRNDQFNHALVNRLSGSLT